MRVRQRVCAVLFGVCVTAIAFYIVESGLNRSGSTELTFTTVYPPN